MWYGPVALKLKKRTLFALVCLFLFPSLKQKHVDSKSFSLDG